MNKLQQPSLKQPNWYVLYTYPNAEKRICKFLTERRFNVYLPLVQVVRQWKDRRKKVQVPLFPNYLFVNALEKERFSALKAPGSVKFLSIQGKPSTISAKEIDFIKKAISQDFEIHESSIEIGAKVRVVSGPFLGIEGVLVEKRGGKKLVVKLNAIEKLIHINISNQLLAKCQVIAA